MTGRAGIVPLRLLLARACAWALLIAGWVGIGALALRYAPSIVHAFALVALWLLALGAAARLATGGGVRVWTRTLWLGACAALAAGALWFTVHGGGLPALTVALIAWAALTAVASGVVRGLRRAATAAGPPAPPIAAAGIGAMCAGLVLNDPGDLTALVDRLATFVGIMAIALALLQHRAEESPRAPGCRAGLFDCSLPAWPAGAWRDTSQWPTLLAGLAMLPMMAALPLMAAWCRAEAVAPQAMVLLHLAAMFGPALLMKQAMPRWRPVTLSIVCTVLLAVGAVCALWAPAPFGLLGLAFAHGAAWGLAWGGQLWAPARRGEQGASPLRAAAGYAALTLMFGVLVEYAGANGVVVMHTAIALAAVLVWVLRGALRLWPADAAKKNQAAIEVAAARHSSSR